AVLMSASIQNGTKLAGFQPIGPVAAPSRTGSAAAAPDDRSGIATRTGAARRILIVEDDYLVGAQMETSLAQAGVDVVDQAGSLEGALELAAWSVAALAVVDIRLAGRRDGIETAIELRRRHGVRSVFAAAHLGPDVRERAAPADPVGWLAKPYTMLALVQA